MAESAADAAGSPTKRLIAWATRWAVVKSGLRSDSLSDGISASLKPATTDVYLVNNGSGDVEVQVGQEMDVKGRSYELQINPDSTVRLHDEMEVVDTWRVRIGQRIFTVTEEPDGRLKFVDGGTIRYSNIEKTEIILSIDRDWQQEDVKFLVSKSASGYQLVETDEFAPDVWETLAYRSDAKTGKITVKGIRYDVIRDQPVAGDYFFVEEHDTRSIQNTP